MKGLLNLSNPEPGMVSYKCKPMKPVLCYWVFGITTLKLLWPLNMDLDSYLIKYGEVNKAKHEHIE